MNPLDRCLVFGWSVALDRMYSRMISVRSDATLPASANNSSASCPMIPAIFLLVLRRRRELVPLHLRQIGWAHPDLLGHFPEPNLLGLSLAPDESSSFSTSPDAQTLFARQEPREKRRLLNFLLSNCSWEGGEVVTTFRQPFDLLAEPAMTAARAVSDDESSQK
jgi:hypothetical protein